MNKSLSIQIIATIILIYIIHNNINNFSPSKVKFKEQNHNVACLKGPRQLTSLPEKIVELFNSQSQHVYDYWMNDSSLVGSKHFWFDSEFETNIKLIEVNNYSFCGYHECVELHKVLSNIPKSSRVLVMNSIRPWVESFLIFHDFAYIDVHSIFQIENHSKHIKLIDQIEGKYDLVIDYSTIEHEGLGRWGDCIDPNQDVIRAEKVKETLKPGGYWLLSVHVGLDVVFFNAHRVYRERLKILTHGFTLVLPKMSLLDYIDNLQEKEDQKILLFQLHKSIEYWILDKDKYSVLDKYSVNNCFFSKNQGNITLGKDANSDIYYDRESRMNSAFFGKENAILATFDSPQIMIKDRSDYWLSIFNKRSHIKPDKFDRMISMISNCVTWRIAKLMLYSDLIDQCGQCVILGATIVKCDNRMKYMSETMFDEIDDYAYHISMENTHEPNYVTEKFYRTLALNRVPVIFDLEMYPKEFQLYKNFIIDLKLCDHNCVISKLNREFYEAFTEFNNAMFKNINWAHDYDIVCGYLNYINY